ncbi:O-antigen ligase [uncultured Thiothrix sp.]|uniref:O-antigen ligase family protein n=1 Tax=uncultured Thiothrix sp. TaxID=223185 RepID=UPI00260DD21F|nr:O-antigen ligase family protein [uncultured Thiothrix sp.]
MESIRKLALLCLLLFIFAVPTDGLWTIAGLALVKISGLLLFGMVALLIISGDSMRGSPWFFITMTAYICWMLFSFLWTWMPVNYETSLAINSEQSIKEYLYLFMAVLLAFQVVRTEQDLNLAFAAYLLGAIGLTYFLVRGYDPNSTTVRHEIRGFDANETSLQLSLGLPMALYLLLLAKSWLLRGLGLVYIPIVLFGIFITGSRTGFITALLGFIGLIPWFWRTKFIWKLVGLGFFVVIALGVTSMVPQKTLDRLFSSGTELSQGTLSSRSITWSRAWLEINEAPFFGNGLSSFRRVINKYNIDYTAHNSYIAIMVEQGIVGLLTYLAVIITVLLQAFKIPTEQRLLMLSLLFIAIAGQFTLTLNGRMFIWFAYLFIVIKANLEYQPQQINQNYQLRLA